MSLIRPLSAPIDKTHPPGYRAGYRENNKYNPKDIKKWAACIDIDGGALRPFIRGNQKFYTIPHNDHPCFALSIAWSHRTGLAASLFGVTSISDVLARVEHAVKGRLLVFFSGRSRDGRKRPLDAR
jgi:hypothetical protein